MDLADQSQGVAEQLDEFADASLALFDETI